MTDISESSVLKPIGEKIEEEEEEEISEKHYDPQKWPNLKKYRVLFLVALPTLLTPLSNAPLEAAILMIQSEFQTTTIIANSLFGIFLVVRGIAPIFWSSYSDQLRTRKKVYLTSLLLYTSSNIICGFSESMLILIIFRILQTIGISAALTIGGGIVSDLFISSERGIAYAVYLVGYFLALATGPYIGDLITQFLGWRWIFYILAISGGATLLLITSFLPETFRSSGEEKLPLPKPHQIEIIRELNPKSPTEESKTFAKRKIYNPVSPIKFLFRLNALLSILSKSIAYVILYSQSILITRLFSFYYYMPNLHSGLVLISPTVGFLIGSFITGKYSDDLVRYEKDIEMRNVKEKEMSEEVTQGTYKFPIVRIKVALYSSLLVPLFIAAFGWLVQYRVHIAVPIICLFITGIGLQGQSNCISTYLIDAYPERSASVLASSDFISYSLTATMILTASPLESFVGAGWTFSIMALFSILSVLLLVIVLKYDERWRGVKHTN